jgi:hypothetical protein
LLSDFIIAFACEEDSTELRQKFGEYWWLTHFNYLNENSSDEDGEESFN